MATLDEVRAWATLVSDQQTERAAKIARERALPLPRDQVERRLRAALLGQLRRDAALLRARARFLAVADAALVAEEAHPVQRMTAPVGASGQVSAPRTPDRRLAL